MVKWEKTDIAMLVAKNAMKWMIRRDMNQKALAEKMGVTEPYISMILGGKKITVLVIAKLATSLDIDPSLLLDK